MKKTLLIFGFLLIIAVTYVSAGTCYCDNDQDGYISNYNVGSQYYSCYSSYSCGNFFYTFPCTRCQSLSGNDCNDNQFTGRNIHVGAQEICNGVDDNCNGQIDEGCINYYCDNDKDGYISSTSAGACMGTNCAPAGCSITPGNDCNDNNRFIHQGAQEICNNLDDNCNDQIDEGLQNCRCTNQSLGRLKDSQGNPIENATRNNIDDNCDDCSDGTCFANSTLTGRCSNCVKGKPLSRFTTSVPSSDIALLDFVWYDITTKLRIS